MNAYLFPTLTDCEWKPLFRSLPIVQVAVFSCYCIQHTHVGFVMYTTQSTEKQLCQKVPPDRTFEEAQLALSCIVKIRDKQIRNDPKKRTKHQPRAKNVAATGQKAAMPGLNLKQAYVQQLVGKKRRPHIISARCTNAGKPQTTETSRAVRTSTKTPTTSPNLESSEPLFVPQPASHRRNTPLLINAHH